jgi:hypothetical protein
MKKIWNEINRRVHLKWYAGISIILSMILSRAENYNWWEAAIFGLIFFIIFSGLAYVNHVQEEKQVKYNENRFGEDPEWAEYKKLKKKFRNR